MLHDQFKYFETSPTGALVPDRLANVLIHLSEAYQCATGFGDDQWQFALDIRTLRDLGATDNDCRWLVRTEHVEHGIESTLHGDTRRTFRISSHAVFSDRSAFILTDAGIRLFQRINRRDSKSQPAHKSLSEKPTWNDQRKTLCLGDQIVKRFKLPAPNQTTVLKAFQEEHWPHCIDDPLPPKPGQEPKRRLHDTINSLNRNQKKALIRFSGDGTGKGICWELISDDAEGSA